VEISRIGDFVLGLAPEDIPDDAWRAAKRSLLDLVGVWAAGRTTPLSRIVHDHAAELFGPGGRPAALTFDGRAVSPAGAALAGGMTIDSIDAHDGYRPSKGHAGCGLLPALVASVQATGRPTAGPDFLAALVVGYEIACRTAVAQHTSVPDYHATGSWSAVGCAAVAARCLDLDLERLRHAMGIAEYHGPRSQMMRVIDHPTMLKDSSGWGAMAGVSAAWLARDGFTGAPAITVEAEAAADLWDTLGSTWLMTEQYIKPWPVCRWAQPSIEGVLRLVRSHGLSAADVRRVEIATFHEATRLQGRAPTDTETAQYAICFPVAAALVHGDVPVAQIVGEGLRDEAVLTMARRIDLVEDAECQSHFPARRTAKVSLELADGRRLESGLVDPSGDPDNPMSDADLRAKFHRLAAPVLGADRAAAMEEAIGRFDSRELALADLLGQLPAAPASAARAETPEPVP